MIFNSRRHAGQLLAEELQARNIKPDIVYGLARGGVAVAAEVASAFKIPLAPLVVRKISPPGNPEFAVGALAAVPDMEGREPSVSAWWDEGTLRRLNLPVDWQKRQIINKKLEISEYLRNLSLPKAGVSWLRQETPDNINFRNIVLADDGAATGATMMAAIEAVRKVYKGPALPRQGRALSKLIVVLPVASSDAAEKIRRQADETVILSVDPDFRAVGQYYRSFEQVSWKEVGDRSLLALPGDS